MRNPRTHNVDGIGAQKYKPGNQVPGLRYRVCLIAVAISTS